MAQLVEIRKVEIGPKNMIAHVRLAEGCPLMTSEDLEGTARVYRVMPHIVEHACLGDAGETFRDAMGNTEVAHLLEHVTVELLAQTDLAGDMPAGRTWVSEVDDRTYQIELSCPDDVLVAAALSTGAWILDWAYSGGGEPEPDMKAIVGGLVALVQSVEGEGEDLVLDMPYEEMAAAAAEAEAEEALDDALEPEFEDADEGELDESEPEADVTDSEPVEFVPDPEPEPAAAEPLWTDVPVYSARTPQTRRAPAVEESEVDQIMATIEMPPVGMDEE